jgi:hypothetical protein
MLWRFQRELRGCGLHATDGDIGKVDDLFFDDLQWVVRYLVVDTGGWLTGRLVLISPHVVGEPDMKNRRLPVMLTRDKVKHSPSIEEDMPVSRQYETMLRDYYDWPTYWAAPGWAGVVPGPAGAYMPGFAGVATAERPRSRVEEELNTRLDYEKEHADPHLRSVREVTGYRIEARDGGIGHVDDFLVDAAGWETRYLIVDTRNWLPGRKVLVAPGWVRDISWDDNKVYLDLTREEVKNSPEFDLDVRVGREYEQRLWTHYRRPPYWDVERELRR